MKRVIHFATVSALSASCAIASAAGLVQVDDEQLSDVSGQDGVYLNLKGFSLNSAEHFGYGPLKLTYTMPYEGASAAEGDPLGLDPSKPVNYIEYGKFSISRTDPLTEAEIFSDPYQIQIEKIPVLGWDDDSLAAYGFDLVNPTEEVIRLQNPKNANGSIKWDMTYDWKVVTGFRKDGLGAAPVTHDMGARIVDDLVIRGGGLSLAPARAWNQSSADARGIAFGLDLNVSIGALILRPRGRDDASSELALRGIKIGAANDDRTGGCTCACSSTGAVGAVCECVVRLPNHVAFTVSREHARIVHAGADEYFTCAARRWVCVNAGVRQSARRWVCRRYNLPTGVDGDNGPRAVAERDGHARFPIIRALRPG